MGKQCLRQHKGTIVGRGFTEDWIRFKLEKTWLLIICNEMFGDDYDGMVVCIVVEGDDTKHLW